MREGKSFHKFGAAHPNERSPRVGNVLRVVVVIVYKLKFPSFCYTYIIKGLSIYSIIKGLPILFLIFFVQKKGRNKISIPTDRMSLPPTSLQT